MKELGWIALAGAGGTVSRYLLVGAVQRLFGERFPWGILVVNIIGCFMFGLIWMLAENQIPSIDERTRLIVLTGFMGAFTTFSTFAFEGGIMIQEAQWLSAALHILGQNILGILCVFAGFTVGKMF